LQSASARTQQKEQRKKKKVVMHYKIHAHFLIRRRTKLNLAASRVIVDAVGSNTVARIHSHIDAGGLLETKVPEINFVVAVCLSVMIYCGVYSSASLVHVEERSKQNHTETKRKKQKQKKKRVRFSSQFGRTARSKHYCMQRGIRIDSSLGSWHQFHPVESLQNDEIQQ
jgi:hypothetical protein